ncbi:hypothetical protein F5Y17DRAFT_11110 [Xylariaceae sp. FL0594]|nr:hypothetical protein F5Y17DRAFT_11110 [Xylariaceae sp. FL0594]
MLFYVLCIIIVIIIHAPAYIYLHLPTCVHGPACVHVRSCFRQGTYFTSLFNLDRSVETWGLAGWLVGWGVYAPRIFFLSPSKKVRRLVSLRLGLFFGVFICNTKLEPRDPPPPSRGQLFCSDTLNLNLLTFLTLKERKREGSVRPAASEIGRLVPVLEREKEGGTSIGQR